MHWYVVKFSAILAVLFTAQLTVVGQRLVVEPWTACLASLSALLTSAFIPGVNAVGNVISAPSGSFAVAIVAGCSGVEAVVILAAAMLSFKTSSRHRALGLLAGFVAVQVANVARVISLFLLGLWDRHLFEIAHLYLWQLLVMVDVVVVWLLWLRFLPVRLP